jgi:hypothetical protein
MFLKKSKTGQSVAHTHRRTGRVSLEMAWAANQLAILKSGIGRSPGTQAIISRMIA